MSEHRESMHDPSKFGDTHRLLERSRDAWGWNWLDDAMQDLTVGVRTLVKSPSFAITATLILTFGIGLNVTLFQMIRVGLLRPPALKDVDSWVRFLRAAPNSTTSDRAVSAGAVREGQQQRAGRGAGRNQREHGVGTRRRRTDQRLVRVGELVRRDRLRPLARADAQRSAGRARRRAGGRAQLHLLAQPPRRQTPISSAPPPTSIASR